MVDEKRIEEIREWLNENASNHVCVTGVIANDDFIDESFEYIEVLLAAYDEAKERIVDINEIMKLQTDTIKMQTESHKQSKADNAKLKEALDVIEYISADAQRVKESSEQKSIGEIYRIAHIMIGSCNKEVHNNWWKWYSELLTEMKPFLRRAVKAVKGK